MIFDDALKEEYVYIVAVVTIEARNTIVRTEKLKIIACFIEKSKKGIVKGHSHWSLVGKKRETELQEKVIVSRKVKAIRRGVSSLSKYAGLMMMVFGSAAEYVVMR